MINQVQNCLFIGGAEFKFNPNNPDKMESGMYEEYLIAKKFNRNIFPIYNSGYQAKRIFNEEKGDIPKLPDNISTYENIEKTVNSVIKYLNEQKMRLLILDNLD